MPELSSIKGCADAFSPHLPGGEERIKPAFACFSYNACRTNFAGDRQNFLNRYLHDDKLIRRYVLPSKRFMDYHHEEVLQYLECRQ